jgi:hypothetical protein
MPPKNPFGPEVIKIDKHTQYSLQAEDRQYYKVNPPLTMAHFQPGMSYTVSGFTSAKGNKYISKMEPVGAPAAPPVPSTPDAPVTPAAPRPVYSKPAGDNVPGKVACVISNGVATFVSGIVQDEVQFVAKYESLMKQIMEVHKRNGWL